MNIQNSTSAAVKHTIPISVLDLAHIVVGGTAADSLRNTLDLAQHAERWGYRRYWLAEHHNLPGIASSATSLLIGYVASGTKTICVGSGGIMLPNHAPLIIAEQFGTLETLYPGRIDLGLGRAPGSDQPAVRALRRSLGSGEEIPAVTRRAALLPVWLRHSRCAGRSRRRPRDPDVAARLERLQRSAGWRARATVLLRQPLRSGLFDTGP